MTDAFTSELHDKVGGIPTVMGPWQLELLKKCGLRRHSTVLDLGCGTLRGGLPLIEHLYPRHYVGIDPLPSLIADARKLLKDAEIAERAPDLDTLENFGEYASQSFDFVLTQSVLNHLNAAQIEETVARVALVLSERGKWVSTGCLSDDVDRVDEGSPHPTRPDERLHSVMGRSWFIRLLRRYGMEMVEIDDHQHPRGLDVFMVTKDVSKPPSGDFGN